MTPEFLKTIRGEITYPYPVLGLGNFDGLHIGHQSILKRVVQKAEERNGTAMAFTFDPHPVKVLFPERALELLCTTREKIELIEKCGISTIFCIEFTKEFSFQTPRDFVKTFLVNGLKVREVMVGKNYGFGQGRSGNVDMLQSFGAEFGFHVEIIPPVVLKGQMVSSSLIRNFLLEGKVQEANRLLGRPYQIEGTVVAGEGRGRKLGFPTANILPGDKLIPGNGVYAVRAEKKSETFSGIVYIGTQPTFENALRQIEVHLFKNGGTLYGEELKVDFYGKVRNEMKFPDREALIQQITRDIVKAKEILNQPN
ncbi:MAG: bifunctional riboflavin kinase/FAD synthetase [Nitrospirae bacterium]|nr:bifunctional riboflavin kinase/FAD synthetase [Nitrospirota bacterium]MBI3594891.1 bifunctional riboflavin kinase/FAD synthetase [Nitrospirota bacterium]